jgi:predicted RNA-binding protein
MIRVLENKDCINSFSLKKEKRKLRKKFYYELMKNMHERERERERS